MRDQALGGATPMTADHDRTPRRAEDGGFNPFGKDAWSWFLVVPILLTGGLLLIPMFLMWYFTNESRHGPRRR